MSTHGYSDTFQSLAADRAKCYYGCGETAGEVPASPPVLEAFVHQVRHIVGMGRAGQKTVGLIVAAADVGVLYSNADGVSGGKAVEHTAQYPETVRFYASRFACAARTAAGEGFRDVCLINRNAAWHAIEHGSDGLAVALAKQCQGYILAKDVAHNAISWMLIFWNL